MRGFILAVAAIAIVAGGAFVFGQHGVSPGSLAGPPSYSLASASVLTRAGLPSAAPGAPPGSWRCRGGPA